MANLTPSWIDLYWEALSNLWRPAKSETGEMNAIKFARVVIKDSNHSSSLYYSMVTSSPNAWPWMRNELWRARVLELLKDHSALFTDFGFKAPDNDDTWRFVAEVKKFRSVSELTLDEVYHRGYK